MSTVIGNKITTFWRCTSTDGYETAYRARLIPGDDLYVEIRSRAGERQTPDPATGLRLTVRKVWDVWLEELHGGEVCLAAGLPTLSNAQVWVWRSL